MSLHNIQTSLNAPKDKTNAFGKYKYRSAESILEALKPLLSKHQYSLVINDALELVGDRYYIKATVSLYDEKMSLITHSSAYAREELSLKGQQASQITGSTSSYARKYALSGLFLIDDSVDADGMDNSNHVPEVRKEVINASQVKLLNTLMSNKKVDRETLKEHYKITSFNDLPTNAMEGLVKYLEAL